MYLKNLHYKDLLALLTRIAGLSILITDSAFVSSVNSLFGKDGVGILAGIGFVTTLAADFLRVSGAPSGDFIEINNVVQHTNTEQNITTASTLNATTNKETP